MLARRPHVGDRARRVAERIGRRGREGGRIEPRRCRVIGRRQPVREAAGRGEVDARHQVRPLPVAAEQAGVVLLNDADREPALDVDRR